MTYHTLSTPCQAVYEIKKSQFLAFAYPINKKEQLMFHMEHLQKTYSDARHICYGYIIGDPHNTTFAGFSDDGEPNGTAGRPILNVLQHKAIGNCVVFVVRYFGGIKLGAGGLTRAYATATQMVVDKMSLVPFVPKSVLTVMSSFANEAQVRYLVGLSGGEIMAVDYAQNVQMRVQMDCQKVADFENGLGMFGWIVR